jgi:16S rRNA C967 or C1407 C5-methylase (RsmB/RsmF family)
MKINFQKLSEVLLQETILNNVFRQELVSMLPVALLDIKKTDTVLDMCAVI